MKSNNLLKNVNISKALKYIAIIIVIPGAIYALCAIVGLIRSCTVVQPSYKSEILQELQYGRDTLAYTTVCFDQSYSRPPSFSLLHKEKVPELFADNETLRKDIRFLYEAISSSKNQAKELMRLLNEKNADPEAIRNIKVAIEKTVKLADDIGPRIAKYVSGSWETPPLNMNIGQMTEYYEKRLSPTATAPSAKVQKW